MPTDKEIAAAYTMLQTLACKTPRWVRLKLDHGGDAESFLHADVCNGLAVALNMTPEGVDEAVHRGMM